MKNKKQIRIKRFLIKIDGNVIRRCILLLHIKMTPILWYVVENHRRKVDYFQRSEAKHFLW